MIPNNPIALGTEVVINSTKSKNYKLDSEKLSIKGYVDGLEAMGQIVNKILNTERYRYIIYSWNFGIELEDLFGKPVNYVIPELKRRITEALVQDNRILSVEDFNFDTSKRSCVIAAFKVVTIYGTIENTKEVRY